MSISLIVAASTNNAIGKNGQLLWHLPKDLRFFKNTTWGMPVIMGRKTFAAVAKPLPGRVNIVVTSRIDWIAEGVWVANNLEEAIMQAEKTNCKEIFIIGGGEIYKQAMKLAHKMYITRVHEVFEADAFFPAINEKEWKLAENIDFQKDEKHSYSFSIQTWMRYKEQDTQ